MCRSLLKRLLEHVWMGAVAQCKASLRALELMLADNLTAADTRRRIDEALRLNRGLQLPKDMPRSTLKKLLLELKVPYHLGVAYSRVAQRCPWSDAAYAVCAGLTKVLRCLSESPTFKNSNSLVAAVQQQLEQSGLVQHLPAVLEAACTRLEALAGVKEARGVRSTGPSSSSSSSSGVDSIVPMCHSINHDAILHITVLFTMVFYVVRRMTDQQLSPHFCPLAASVLHLVLTALQYASRQVHHLQQQQQQQQQQVVQLLGLLVAIRDAALCIASAVMDDSMAEDMQQLPGAELLLQSPHTLPGLAAVITLEGAALEAAQQGPATDWDDRPAAALRCWQQSHRTADSLGVAARWLQQALGLEPQAVRFAALCLEPGAKLLSLWCLLTVFHDVVVELPQEQQAAVQQGRQCGQQGVQQLQWLLLVPAAVCPVTAVAAQQATAADLKIINFGAVFCATSVQDWVASASLAQQLASPLLQACSLQQGEPWPCALPAWYVNDVLPPLLSTAAHLQQRMQARAADAAAAAVQAPGADQHEACDAFTGVGQLLCCLLQHALAVRRVPDDARAGNAAAAAAGSILGSSRSPAVNLSASETWADLPVSLTELAISGDMLSPSLEVVIPEAVAEHVVQVLTALTALVRATPALAGPTYDPLTPTLGEFCSHVLEVISLVCEGQRAECQGRTPLLLLLDAAGSSRGPAEQQLQGLLVSMLKLSGTAAELPAAALSVVQPAVAACRDAALLAAAAALDAVSGQPMQATPGGGAGGGGPAAVGCPGPGSEDMVQGAAAAAATSAVSGADISHMLPFLVVIGRWSLHWSDLLQQQVGAGTEANGTTAAAAASSHGCGPTPGCHLTVGELRKWLSACKAVSCWLHSSNHSALLQEAGYDPESFQQAYLKAGGVHMAAVLQVDLEPIAADHLPQLAQLLATVGQVTTSLATSVMCNNPRCCNLSGPSEQQLESGRSCICAGCCTARYCGRACQKQHWKQHKAVCKALAAAAASPASL